MSRLTGSGREADMDIASSEEGGNTTGSVLPLLLPLNGIILLGFMSIAAPLPILPLIMHKIGYFSPIVSGLIVGAQSISTVVSRRFAGHIVDRLGATWATRRGLLVCVLSGLSFILSAFVLTFPLLAFAILLIGRIILGIGESMILTGAITWGIDRVGSRYSGTVMSWNGIAMYAALAAGAPIGLYAFNAQASLFLSLLLVGAILVLLPVLGSLVAHGVPASTIEKPDGINVSFSEVLEKIWPLGCALTFQMAGYGTIISFLTLVYASHHWSGAGTAFVFFGMAVVAVRFVFGGLPDKFGGRAVAVSSLCLSCAGQIILWQAVGPGFMVIGTVLTGMGVALGFPALGVEALKRVPPSNRGLVIAIFSAFQDLAFGLTGPVTGLFIRNNNYQSVFVAGAAGAVVAAVLVLISTQRRRVV